MLKLEDIKTGAQIRGIESAHGISLAANWTFDDRWMPYARLGVSKGSKPIYNESVTVGLLREYLYRSDVVGLSFNHGSPPDQSLRDQTTVEVFWRFQVSRGSQLRQAFSYCSIRR